MPTFNNRSEIGKIYYADGNGHKHEIQKGYYVNGNSRWLVFSAAEPSDEYVISILAQKHLFSHNIGDNTHQQYNAFYPPYHSVIPGHHIYLRVLVGMWAQSVQNARGYAIIEWYTSSKVSLGIKTYDAVEIVNPPIYPGGWDPSLPDEVNQDNFDSQLAHSSIDRIVQVPSNAAYIRIGFYHYREGSTPGAGQGNEYILEGVVADIEEPYSCGYTNVHDYSALYPKNKLEEMHYPKYD